MTETQKKKNTTLIFLAIAIFLVLVALKFGLSGLAEKLEGENIYSLSDLKYDDSTYNYVKKKCDEGLLSANSVNCQNMRIAR